MVIEQQAMITKLQEQIVVHEHDLLRRLKEARDDQMSMIIGNQDEKVSIEKIKSDRNDSELTFMRV